VRPDEFQDNVHENAFKVTLLGEALLSCSSKNNAVGKLRGLSFPIVGKDGLASQFTLNVSIP
jgi:hypothetical protein